MSLLLAVLLLFPLVHAEECDCSVSVVSSSNTYSAGIYNGNTGCGPSESADPVDNWNGKSVYYRALDTGGVTTVYDFQIDCLYPCWIKNINMEGCGWWQSRLILYNGDKSTQLGNKLVSSNSYSAYLSNVNLDLTGNEVYLTQFRFVETNIDTGSRYRTPFTITSQQLTDHPTTTPTQAPTNKNCEDVSEIKHINWHELQNNVDNSAQLPYSSFSVNLDKNKLEMTFDIDLEYVGLSADGNFDSVYTLGTTYVIGFDSFGTTGNKINEPGNCENRIPASFSTGTFDQWWNYSEYPYLSNNDLGSDTYLAYPPPSNYWSLSIGENVCTPINYLGVFSWNDLTQCKDYNGNDLINVVDNDISITLSGTLYANLVSPYSMNAVDTGIYRSFPLIQQDFEISILKQINVLSSTGVELFITSIIGIYEDESDGSFELSILTQSADYIKLINPTVVATPFGIATGVSITSTSTTCLSASTYTCGQIFTLSISSDEINCPPADMSGVYDIAFDVECRFNEDVCNTFINDNPSGTSVALSVESNFIDTYCEPEMYSVIFEGDMKFYDDAEFVIDHSISGDNYVIGQDTIYVEIVVDFPEDGSVNNYYNVFQVDVENVFVCTADDTVDMTQDLDQQNGNGGCLSSNIDADGAYDIIINGVEMNYDANIILTATESNVVRFSFKTFDIGRTKMY
eukprot:498824_1